MRKVVFLSLLFGLFAASSASANGRFPQSNEITFHPRDPLTIYARTTFGLLVTHDGGDSWKWICEGALGLRPTEDPPIGIVGDGHILASLYVGQKVGTPDGCNFDFAAPSFAGVYTIDNAVDPSDVDRAYVITSAGGRTPMNQPWRTDDDGAHWTALGAPIPNVLFETIDVAKSDPMRVYMTGALPPITGVPCPDGGAPDGSSCGPSVPRMPFVYHSIDGVHFDVYPYALGPTDENIYIAGVDPTNADRLYVRVSGDQRTSPISPDRLVISDDGGMSFHDVIDFPSMFGFAQSDDGQTVWVGSPGMGLFRSDDRGEHFTNINAVVQVNCLAARGSELWACGNDFTDYFVVGVSHDGGTSFDGKVRLKGIDGPVDCGLCTTCGVCACSWCALATMFDTTRDCMSPRAYCDLYPDAGGPAGVPPTCTGVDGGPLPNDVDGGPPMPDAGSGMDAGASEPGTPPGGSCCGVAGAQGHGWMMLVPLLFLLHRRRRLARP